MVSSACVRVQVLHDETGRMWLMLHSGSRNIGNVTAQYYDKIAQEQLAQQGIKVPGGLNYLEIASEHGQGYLQVRFLTFDSVKCWLQGRTIAKVKHQSEHHCCSVYQQQWQSCPF